MLLSLLRGLQSSGLPRHTKRSAHAIVEPVLFNNGYDSTGYHSGAFGHHQQRLSNGRSTLAPAADIVPSRRPRRSISSQPPPMLTAKPQPYQHHRAHTQTSITAPTTPISAPGLQPRQGILRMPSHQAEKDAVDTLLFMSSPNNSAHLAHTSAAAAASGGSVQQPSPLHRADPAPKRVIFDDEGGRDNRPPSQRGHPPADADYKFVGFAGGAYGGGGGMQTAPGTVAQGASAR